MFRKLLRGVVTNRHRFTQLYNQFPGSFNSFKFTSLTQFPRAKLSTFATLTSLSLVAALNTKESDHYEAENHLLTILSKSERDKKLSAHNYLSLQKAISSNDGRPEIMNDVKDAIIYRILPDFDLYRLGLAANIFLQDDKYLDYSRVVIDLIAEKNALDETIDRMNSIGIDKKPKHCSLAFLAAMNNSKQSLSYILEKMDKRHISRDLEKSLCYALQPDVINVFSAKIESMEYRYVTACFDEAIVSSEGRKNQYANIKLLMKKGLDPNWIVDQFLFDDNRSPGCTRIFVDKELTTLLLPYFSKLKPPAISRVIYSLGTYKDLYKYPGHEVGLALLLDLFKEMKFNFCNDLSVQYGYENAASIMKNNKIDSYYVNRLFQLGVRPREYCVVGNDVCFAAKETTEKLEAEYKKMSKP